MMSARPTCWMLCFGGMAGLVAFEAFILCRQITSRVSDLIRSNYDCNPRWSEGSSPE